jgi:NADP-dependent 3-hydroxy acid dehydrogenase YdfG
MTGLLETRTAVIYGAGGAVAQAFARVGAQVVLAGRRLAPLERVTTKINPGRWRSACSAGGRAG